MSRLVCPHCQLVHQLAANLTDRSITCQNCGQQIQVPGRESKTAADRAPIVAAGAGGKAPGKLVVLEPLEMRVEVPAIETGVTALPLSHKVLSYRGLWQRRCSQRSLPGLDISF